MVLALIVNNTRQSPDRNRIPAAPLSAFTSPTPVSANAVNLRSICARVAAESLRHWRTATGHAGFRRRTTFRDSLIGNAVLSPLTTPGFSAFPDFDEQTTPDPAHRG